MDGFCMKENRIRLQTGLEAAQKARLAIGSRLLALAKIAIGGQRGA